MTKRSVYFKKDMEIKKQLQTPDVLHIDLFAKSSKHL